MPTPRFLFLLSLLIFLLAACSTADLPGVGEPPPAPQGTAEPAPTPTPLPTYTPYPTPTPLPTYTPYPTSTPHLTPTPRPTPTSMPVFRAPTLPTHTPVPRAIPEPVVFLPTLVVAPTPTLAIPADQREYVHEIIKQGIQEVMEELNQPPVTGDEYSAACDMLEDAGWDIFKATGSGEKSIRLSSVAGSLWGALKQINLIADEKGWHSYPLYAFCEDLGGTSG